MPRPKSEIPSYRKHSSGQARVTINGRDYLLGPHGTQASKREYDRLIAEYLGSGRSSSYGTEPEAYLVGHLILDYLQHAKDYYGTGVTSELHRIKSGCKPLKSLYATQRAVDFGPIQFKAVRQAFIDNDQCRTGINAQMKRLARMFKWAAGEGKLPAAVYDTLRLIPSLRRGRTEAKESKPVKPVPADVVAATLAKLNPVVADMVRVQFLTCCRPGELCKLTPAMIDRTGDVWVATLDDHKTAHHGHTRAIFIGPKCQEILTGYLDRDPTERLFRPCDAISMKRAKAKANRTTPMNQGNRAGYSENSRKGKRAKRAPGIAYRTCEYGQAVRRAAKQAGVEHWAPNQLRHSRATEIRKLFGLEGSQVIAGHAKADVTQVYAERDSERAIEIARKAG
ncbi:site-specific tyrosine recombinase XerC [Rubripirellula amarantea]|uniref:Site-specific tyrosine recombinase XerC n=1 Tax=Rubripirellula amarantea TaxID=2527999 RepID=A0A5C5WGX3_9BACT|nr:tyrosine-type recombinase/integrase [Rubripirellula amarantea]TWT49355.1 site-specific tyrosine recombinase XerC [Rubripirellula amarantea]